MEKKLIQAKELYKNQEIPKELKQIMNSVVTDSKKSKKEMYKRRAFAVSLAAGISCMAFVAGLNTSQAFAETMEDIPVIGHIAKILTFKDYSFKSEFINADIKIPAVEGIADKKVEKKINEEIYDKMESLLYEAEIRAKEYKEAQIETGGKEEDFNPINVILDYEVKNIKEEYISFAIFKTEDSFAAYSLETIFYNIDLKNSQAITLEDLFEQNYITVINEKVQNYIDEQLKINPGSYFEGDMGFQSITESQKFYINKNDNPVIVFDKYEIAPGSMGQQEIEIIL